MPPRFLVLSRDRATAYEPRRSEVCISITSPHDLPARLSPKFRAVLRLTFSDIVNNPQVQRPWDVPFAAEHAAEIIAFISRWRDVDQIVVHCMAGMSRSPAVALGICDLQGWAAQELERRHPMWNTWVRGELQRVGDAIAWPLTVRRATADDPLDALAQSSRLWARCEVLDRPCPVPAIPGLYALFFRDIPPGVPSTGAMVHQGFTLLYLGSAPLRSSGTSTLRRRIQQHYRGNASGSPLRLTLGCLLVEQLGINLTAPVGRPTFGLGEDRLSEWMAANMFVAWVEHPEPWTIRAEAIERLRPPFNSGEHSGTPLHQTLAARRQHLRRTE